jgi:pimeloyl-ACP methyl ester carboxylesterase
MTRIAAVPIALALLLTGCDGDSEPPTKATPTTSSAEASSTPESDDGALTLASGATVHYRCTGHGAPAFLLEAGGVGTEEFGSPFVDPLAEAHKVCTYDRLGLGSSDPAPDRRRTVNDVCDVEDQVRHQLHLERPAVLAGQSAGANQVIWCAARHPQEVAALVSIEGYHDDPAELAAEFGKGSWRGNPEHVDWAQGAAQLDEMRMPIGKFPVLVISASNADPGGAKNQRYWLALSPRSRQVVLQGGHDLHFEVPDQVAAEMLKVLPG